jgi:uncharacterized protein YecE (DUF72 family)
MVILIKGNYSLFIRLPKYYSLMQRRGIVKRPRDSIASTLEPECIKGESKEAMSGESRILVGTSGFSYPDWHGTFHPEDIKKRKIHELEFLSEFFDFCEINNSFYRPVSAEVAHKWCQYVANNREFQFTAKLTDVFSHAPGREKKESSSAETIKYTAQDVEDAKKGFGPIADAGRLGALLLQFPISFKHTEGNWDHLIDVFHLFREYPMAVEVRHKSWSDPLVLNALEQETVAFCNIDHG